MKRAPETGEKPDNKKKSKRAKTQEIQVGRSQGISSALATVVPPFLQLNQTIEDRKFEISAMEKALQNACEHTGAIRIFQTIQRYQRRRAASHNVKRLPKRVRQRALHQMARDPPPKKAPVTPCRRIRRSKSRLASFPRPTWLETHVWHAKRMHMKLVNGARIAIQPHLKCRRSLFRATRAEAVVHDASFDKLIEIVGDQKDICRALELVSDPFEAAFSAQQFISGRKRGSIWIHQVKAYPAGSIAKVNFLWQAGQGRLCLWVPLGSTLRTFEAIKSSLKETFSQGMLETDQQEKFAFGGIQVNIVKRLKFVFFGPRCHDVLSQCLGYDWKSEVGQVTSLDVRDPRVVFPVFPKARNVKKRPLRMQEENNSNSKLWDQDYCNSLIESRPTMSMIKARRSALMIPKPLEPLESDIHVPVILIKSENGYELIAPVGWGMPFLNLFVFAGVRVAAKSNVEEFAFESEIPVDFIETLAWRTEKNQQAQEKIEKWERTPKGKRVKDPIFNVHFESLVGADNGKGVVVLHSMRLVKIVCDSLVLRFADFKAFLENIIVNGRELIKTRSVTSELENISASCLKSSFLRVFLDLQDGKGLADAMIHLPLESKDEIDAVVPDDKVVGYTTRGGFSLTKGAGMATGCVTLEGIYNGYMLLKEEENKNNNLQLYIRVPGSRKSRLCSVSIVL